MALAGLARRILVAVAALALAAGPATGAGAAEARAMPAADFERVLAQVQAGTPYDALPARARAVLDAHLLPVDHIVAGVELRFAPAGTAGDDGATTLSWCWIGRVTYYAVAVVGNTLYSYLVEGRWCTTDGLTVDSAQHEWSSGEASAPGWTYHGVQASDGGVLLNEGRAWSRHRFTLDLGGIRWQTNEPCVRMRGSAAGGLTHDDVCSMA